MWDTSLYLSHYSQEICSISEHILVSGCMSPNIIKTQRFLHPSFLSTPVTEKGKKKIPAVYFCSLAEQHTETNTPLPYNLDQLTSVWHGISQRSHSSMVWSSPMQPATPHSYRNRADGDQLPKYWNLSNLKAAAYDRLTISGLFFFYLPITDFFFFTYQLLSVTTKMISNNCPLDRILFQLTESLMTHTTTSYISITRDYPLK